MKKMAKTPAKMKAPKAPAKSKAPSSRSEPVELSGDLPELHKDAPEDYEVEHAVRTLGEAEEIKRDEKMMPHVQKHIDKKVRSLKDLKKLGHQKAVEESEEK